jgi:lipoprotein-anchoring transpeptidase ErfK/SrfK
MSGRHASARAPRYPARLGVTGAVAALVALIGIIVAVVVNSPGPGSAAVSASAKSAARPAPAAIAPANAAPVLTGSGYQGWATGAPRQAGPPSRATLPLVLTAADHQDCPAAAAACVDLARHITWLQAYGRTTFGPVPMEPGQPGGAHQTPRGTFSVQWKGGPSLISNIYYEPMPWATFFAAGGIAFHGGSLTTWSHGCVHLTIADAHYYNEHLPIGAEVVVF